MLARVGTYLQLETHPLTHSLPHPFICNPLPLSNSHEQGRTLELERERSEEGIGEGKEGEDKEHQHPPRYLINIFNPIMLGDLLLVVIPSYIEKG